MLSLSQTTGYAVRALGCLSDLKEGHLMARQIAECTGVPLPYLSKILNALVHAGLVHAKRGYQGGFSLAEPAGSLNLRQIADAVEGPGWDSSCLLGLDDCAEGDPCPAHPFWSRIRVLIKAELERLTVADMAAWERRPHKGKPTCCNPANCGSKKETRLTPKMKPSRTVLKGRKLTQKPT